MTKKNKTEIPNDWRVSIITITQYVRKDWLDLLFRCIKNQTGLAYINDWVIVMDYWYEVLKKDGGILFLYLPDFSQEYWRPWNNYKHKNVF